jgi:outer membrane protein TolC
VQDLGISLNKQHQLSEQATLQIRLRYMYGAIDFLRVLTTQVSQQSLERSQILAKRQLLEYRIQLYRALAGSWELNTLANNKENTDA